MSANNIEQIKAMLERAGKTDLLQKQVVDLDKERLQLEAAMAPDKIYINGWSAFATEPVKDGTEYIRKDALLELMKEKLKKARWYYEMMKHVTGSIGENDTWGKIEAYQEIINKINSL